MLTVDMKGGLSVIFYAAVKKINVQRHLFAAGVEI